MVLANILLGLETWQFVLIILGAVLLAAVLVTGLTLLYVFVISRNKKKEQFHELERKYSYLNALLIGQDSQYIRRLEMISRTNLLYVDIYNNYSQRYKDLFENDDKYCQTSLNQIKSLISKKQFKGIKPIIVEAKKAVAAYETNVNKLDADLYGIIKPEEDSRTVILSHKENYRRVKQLFYSNSNELEIATATFQKLFEKIESTFTQFDQHIESAEYDEANALLPTIQKVVSALENILNEMPNLCILVTKIIPNKIKELESQCQELEAQGLPLFNICYKQRIEKWNEILEASKEKIISLSITGVGASLKEIQDEIETVKKQLHVEVEDRDEFNLDNDKLYGDTIELEKGYMKLCALLPELEKVYQITPEETIKIQKLKEDMNKLSDSRRNLDNYIHSNTRQPYSILRSRLDDLRKIYEISCLGLTDFKAYIDFLKTTTENAYQLVFVYYYRCKQIEASLRSMNLPEFTSKYASQIETVYDLLNNVDTLLKQSPIDVESVNDIVEQLKTNGNALFDEVDNKQRELQLAESALVYANRDRNHQVEVNKQLLALEDLFKNGEFVKVYHEASAIYKNSHIEENK